MPSEVSKRLQEAAAGEPWDAGASANAETLTPMADRDEDTPDSHSPATGDVTDPDRIGAELISSACAHSDKLNQNLIHFPVAKVSPGQSSE
jgi:hypothetical protein